MDIYIIGMLLVDNGNTMLNHSNRQDKLQDQSQQFLNLREIMQQFSSMVLMDLFIISMYHQDQDGNMMVDHLDQVELLVVIFVHFLNHKEIMQDYSIMEVMDLFIISMSHQDQDGLTMVDHSELVEQLEDP
jgi:hypothetical protein